MRKLSDEKIKSIYEMVCNYYNKYLKSKWVKLPNLENSKGYTKDALILVYLAQDYPNTQKISKEELTQFIRQYYPNTNDVQQARHLGTQKGLFIAAGGRDNRDVHLDRGLGNYSQRPLVTDWSRERLRAMRSARY